MLLSATALLAGLAVSLPLGIFASRKPKLAEIALAIAGVIQTVPTLALLVLMVPLLHGAIGFAPAFAALTLYSVLPILVNVILGIRGVDPTLTEAARGLGMSDRQILLRVQLPLATPVIVGGVRTATVLVVGTATLATPVGGKSLGNYIFSGLEMNNMVATVFGCVLAALLAVTLDQFVRLLETAARRRVARPAWLAAAGLLVVLGCGLFGPARQLLSPRRPVVAFTGFTEQYILSEVLRDRLESAGYAADLRRMGSTIQFLALRRDKIDCCVSYTGDVWITLMDQKRPAERREIMQKTCAFLREKYGAVCVGPLGFENAYCFAMRRSRAEELGIATMTDLAKCAAKLSISGDLQFFERPDWSHVRDRYGLKFRDVRPMDSSLMYDFVALGEVDVICAYSTDGRIQTHDLIRLTDDLKAFPPYDAILVVSAEAATRPGFVEALQPLAGTIDDVTMRRANLRVDRDREVPRRAASELIRQLGE
jgi:osmoprotectant transport system permease protein